MDEAIWGIAILLVILVTVTLVGHGIWVILVALFKPRTRTHDEYCTRCGSRMTLYGCPTCIPAPAPPTEPGDLEAAVRVFSRLRERGILDNSKFEWLIAVAESEKARLGEVRRTPETESAKQGPISDNKQLHEPPLAEMPAVSQSVRAEMPQPSLAQKAFDEPIPRSFAESMAGYMETRNIRWGEIIGGLLILGCSLALTISFWSQIEQIPILKFGIFTAMTAAFAALGLYSEHRWKLPYTSRGLLATAVLLVPLNFLAIAALSDDQSGNRILGWGAVLAAFFAFLIFRSGKVLAPSLASALTTGLLVPSLTELLIRKFERPGALPYAAVLISAVLVISYHLITAWVLRKEQVALKERLLVFGSSSFASILSFCFLLIRVGDFSESLHSLAPLVCLFGAPAILVGAWMWNEVKTEAFESVAGTALSTLGAGVIVVGFLFSWPAPGNVLFASVICGLVTYLAAHFTGKWSLRLGGLFFFALSWTVAGNLVFRRISETSEANEVYRAVLSTFSAGALTVFTLILLGVYEFLRSRTREDRSLLIGSAALNLFIFLLAMAGGFGKLHDPQHVTWILVVLAAEAFYFAFRFDEQIIVPAGIGYSLFAWIQFFQFIVGERPDVTVLSFATAALIVTVAIQKRLPPRFPNLPSIINWSMVSITAIGAFTLFGTVHSGWRAFGVSVWLGILWLALGVLMRLYPGFVLFQAALVFGIFQKNRSEADFALWLAVFGAAWSVLRTFARRRSAQAETTDSPSGRLLGMLLWKNLTLDQIASALLLGAMLLSHLGGLFDALDKIQTVEGHLCFSYVFQSGAARNWIILGTLGITFIAGLWDQFNRLAGLCSYALLVSIGFTILPALKLQPPAAVLAAGAVMSIVASLGLAAVSDGFDLQQKLRSLAISRPSESWWTGAVFALLPTSLLVPAFVGSLHFSSWPWRAGAAAEVLLVAALLLYAASRFGEIGRYAATVYSFAGLVLLGFVAVVPGSTGSLFSRQVVVFLSAVILTEFLAFNLYQSVRDWSRCARYLTPFYGITAVFVLSVILLMEFTDRAFWTLNSYPTIPVLLLFSTLLGLCVQAFVCAVKERLDPFGFGEAGLRGYVFASEGMLVLAIVHLRLTMPWLFGTWFQRYWPFGVMIVAFVGVGAGEIFRRRGNNRLAIPLHQTGFFLPLLPALAFWIASSEVNYSALLVLVGALYAMVAIIRQSVVASFLACIAANGALWHYLGNDRGVSIFSRPQLWLMPLGGSILLAAWFNRSRLQEAQMVLLRYASLLLIYVSSTAELIIKGTQAAPWEPLVLMGISVGGILAGVMLRIRSFLYLGTSFLLVSLLAMIWNAATNFGWTWLWYVTGIALGIGIIALFALFEKKKNQLPEISMKLREWNG